MEDFAKAAIMNFFIAFGVMLGGCIIGGIGAFLTSQPPMSQMVELAARLKIWAIVSAIGGTFDAIHDLEQGFLDGTPIVVVKHLLLITCAMTGAHTGTMVVQWFSQRT